MYPVDDTYIHMAIGKTLSSDYVWGITGEEYSSASSSVLYSLILGILFFLFGKNDYLPILVNLIAFSGILYAVYKISLKERLGTGVQVVLLLGIICILPGYSLVLIGMEHSMQLLFNLAFFYVSSLVLSQEKPAPRLWKMLYILGALSGLVRYEGLFIVFVVGLLLFFRKKYMHAVMLGAASVAPLVLFAAYSLFHDLYPIPNSVLIKSDKPSGEGRWLHLFFNWATKLHREPFIWTMFIGAVGIILKSWFGKLRRLGLFVLVILLVYMIHMNFARFGILGRYEAYIILAFFVAVGIFYRRVLQQSNWSIVRWGLVVLVAIPFVLRAWQVSQGTWMGIKSIHGQQYQMARFVEKYYPNETVAINDIGTTSYFTNAKVLDLYGLASMEVTRMRAAGKYNRNALDQLVKDKNVALIMIYDEWFKDKISKDWVLISKWRIKENNVCAFNEVSIYAPSIGQAARLRKNLSEFQNTVPAGIMQVEYNEPVFANH